MLRGALQPYHLIILVVVIIIVFGWKRLPDIARSFGRSTRILKSEIDELKKESKKTVPGETVDAQEPQGSATAEATEADPQSPPSQSSADSRPETTA